MKTTTNTARTCSISTNGARVRLDDGTHAMAYPDPNAPGTYLTVQTNPVTGGDRYDYGWRREQLEAVAA